MNGLITEGIPLGIPVQILTSGLSAGEAPPPPPDVVATGGALSIGVAKLVISNQTGVIEGPIVALPSLMTRLSCQIMGTVTNATLNLSNDGISWFPIFLFSDVGLQYTRTGAKFARVDVEGTGVSAILLARRETF